MSLNVFVFLFISFCLVFHYGKIISSRFREIFLVLFRIFGQYKQSSTFFLMCQLLCLLCIKIVDPFSPFVYCSFLRPMLLFSLLLFAFFSLLFLFTLSLLLSFSGFDFNVLLVFFV